MSKAESGSTNEKILFILLASASQRRAARHRLVRKRVFPVATMLEGRSLYLDHLLTIQRCDPYGQSTRIVYKHTPIPSILGRVDCFTQLEVGEGLDSINLS